MKTTAEKMYDIMINCIDEPKQVPRQSSKQANIAGKQIIQDLVNHPAHKAEIHKHICEGLNEIYIKKNTDYGDSYGQLRARYPDSILIRVFDKFSRLERLLKGNKALVEDESIEDTLLDLVNYCIMEVVERRIEKVEVEE